MINYEISIFKWLLFLFNFKLYQKDMLICYIFFNIVMMQLIRLLVLDIWIL
jgi:hypothetical protein